MSDEDSPLAVHAIELNVYLAAIVVLRVKGDCLEGDRQVKVDYLERSQEHVTDQIAGELLPDNKVDGLFLLIFLEGHSLILLQQHRFLPAELQQYSLVSLARELVDDALVHVSVVDGHQ